MAGLRLFSRERAPKVRRFVLQSVKFQIHGLGRWPQPQKCQAVTPCISLLWDDAQFARSVISVNRWHVVT